MTKTMRRRVLGTVMGLSSLAGCDPNPTGPTFPEVPAAAKDGDSAGAAIVEKGAPRGKGRRKARPVQTIGDPAKN